MYKLISINLRLVNKNIIYALIDPRTGEPRYVGQSIHGLRRATSHQQHSVLGQDTNAHKVRWIKKLEAIGLRYEIAVLYDSPTQIGLDEAEMYWISELKLRGHRLTNIAPGGKCCRHTPESRKKISNAKKGGRRPPFSEEWKSKIAAAAREHRHSSSTKEKIGKANAARQWREDSRAKLSLALAGRPLTQQHRQAISDGSVRTIFERIDPITGEVVAYRGSRAVRIAGYDPSAVCKAVKNPQRKCGGFFWRAIRL